MEKKQPGFRNLSRSEGLAHIENYYKSGLRPRAYYSEHGLTESQFYGWRKRYLALHPQSEEKRPPAKPKKKFHPVKIESAGLPRLSGLEIHYPHGVKIVSGSLQEIEIAKLVELVKLRV